MGKIEPEVSRFFFSGTENAIKHVFGRDYVEEFKGRDIACERLVYKKSFQKLSSKEFWLRNSSLSHYRVNTIWYAFIVKALKAVRFC